MVIFHGKLFFITSPFIDGLPIKNGDFPWQTVSHNQMVSSTTYLAPLVVLPAWNPRSVIGLTPNHRSGNISADGQHALKEIWMIELIIIHLRDVKTRSVPRNSLESYIINSWYFGHLSVI